ncbi:hypothetical protein KEM52_003903 [Ascosphaera acerosa]|nr:hypothetical protein KEM52_003903 [Ascosphaera acerosa]
MPTPQPAEQPPQDRLRVWRNGATVPEPVRECIQDYLGRTAQAQPDKPAVDAWDGQLTYGQLDELAARLAYRIVHRHGAARSVFMMFDKSAWASVAVLGAIKAGKPFVFLDPRVVEQKLQHRMRGVLAGDGLMLVSDRLRELAARISSKEGIVVVNQAIQHDSGPLLAADTVARDPRAIAYLAFSSQRSGSRCCAVSHENVCSALHHQTPYLGFAPDSRVFDLAAYDSEVPPFGVDIAIHNMLATWATGGCLCVPRPEELRHDALAGAMSRMGATLAQLPAQACRAITPETVPSLRTLVVVGELRTTDGIEHWWQRSRDGAGGVQIIRANGPIECTAYAAINYAPASLYELQSLGCARGCNIWIVSPRGLLVPWGHEGELLVEGPIVSSGYLNNPEMTRKHFIRDIKWLKNGAFGVEGRPSLTFRTGDVGKYDSKGNLFITGRVPSAPGA